MTLIAAVTLMVVRPGLHLVDVLSRTWDAAIYLEAVRRGYPHAGPITDPHAHNAVAGLFPLYPGAISLTSRVLGLPLAWAGVLVALVSGGMQMLQGAPMLKSPGGRPSSSRSRPAPLFSRWPIPRG